MRTRSYTFCQADAQGRGTWLISSNYANAAFYESHGFVPKREVVLGDKNPTWGRPPVVMLLVRSTSFILRGYLMGWTIRRWYGNPRLGTFKMRKHSYN